MINWINGVIILLAAIIIFLYLLRIKKVPA